MVPENPDYVSIFDELEVTSDLVRRQELIESAYKFNQPLEDFEKELFSYVLDGYIDNNPGVQGNSFSSYVGVYFSNTGETT